MQLNVLLLPVPNLFDPWCRDIVEIVDRDHPVTVYDSDKPLADQFAAAQIVIDHGGHIGTHEMMDASTHVQLWQIMSIGYERVDIDYLKSKVSQVANVPGSTSAASQAETALMFILMLSHRARERDQSLRAGRWLEPESNELEGRTLGIVGLGNSGRHLARIAAAMGMEVLGANRTEVKPADLGLTAYHPLDQLDDLIKQSDFISLHLAVTPETKNIIDARRIGLMKSTAYIINTSRGTLIDQPALFDALLQNRIAGAGLDVFETEPPDNTHPVFNHPQVVVTPHVAAFTDGSSRKRAEFIAQNINLVSQGREPMCLIA